MKKLALISLVALLSYIPWYAQADMTPKEAAVYLQKSVVRVGDDYCSGAKIGPNMFLTAGHCAQNPSFRDTDAKVCVEFDCVWVKSILFPVAKKKSGYDNDWAILYTFEDLPKVDALKIVCGETHALGEKIAYLGYPYPTKYAFVVGYLSSLESTTGDGKDGNQADLLVDLPASGGSSGSVAISLETGHVVGVVTEVVYGDRNNIFLTGIQSIKNLDQCQAVATKDGKPDNPLDSK